MTLEFSFGTGVDFVVIGGYDLGSSGWCSMLNLLSDASLVSRVIKW